jgi:SAM-dependent methyltransferase
MSASAPHNELTGTELNDWFSSSLGRMLLEAEYDLIGEWATDLFGYQLLDVSLFDSDLSYLDRCAIKNKVHISPSATPSWGRQLELRGQPEKMPVATDYIDAVVLLHTLDFAADPRQVLRESERVLIPEGRLIVCGFNPYSLWGARRWLPGAGKRAPWKGKFISYARLQDWFSLLGFDVERTTTLMFRLPVQHQPWLGKLDTLESLGQRWWPWLAGVYVVQAVKRVSTVTPIRPHWHLERKTSKAAVEPGSSMKPYN